MRAREKLEKPWEGEVTESEVNKTGSEVKTTFSAESVAARSIVFPRRKGHWGMFLEKAPCFFHIVRN